MTDIVPGSCDQCKYSGLPILPVRYAVVPSPFKPDLPKWASGERVKSVDLGSEFQYAVRVLRAGYIYLFYDKHARGSNYWECYLVSEDGSLTRQSTPQAANPTPPASMPCTTQSNPAHKHYLVIEQPHKCGTAWIAFSQHKWSDETLDDYTGRADLREQRMQAIEPAAMVGGAKNSHGAVATEAALEGVVEYTTYLELLAMIKPPPSGPISRQDGQITGPIDRMTSRYPMAELRHYLIWQTLVHMRKRAQDRGRPGTPHVLALWDAMGITHELNGFRNEAAGWIAKYNSERALQVNALNLYDGLEKVLQEAAHKRLEAAGARRRQGFDPLQAREDRARAMLQREPRHPEWIKELADVQHTRYELEHKKAENVQRYVAEAWPKYEQRIGSERAAFKTRMQAGFDRITRLVDARTPALVAWLESPLLIDSLNDYHHANIEDGLLFEEDIGEALMGLGASPKGAKKIEEWVAQCQACDTNLLWRAVALNQKQARQDLNVVLAEARQAKEAAQEANAEQLRGQLLKVGKGLADTYYKAHRLGDANRKAGAAPSTGNPRGGNYAFGTRLKAVNTRGVDKLAVSAGDAVFRFFRIDKLGDFVCEKLIQHVFSIRAFVTPADSINLILKQVEVERATSPQGIGRKQVIERLRTARSFLLDPPKGVQAEDLKAQWAKFKVDNPSAAEVSMKDARLALVVALIESANFAKLMAACKEKGDARSYLMLLASAMSITSASLEIAATVAKNLPSMGSDSWTHQGIKMWGGMLSAGASFMGAYFDKQEADKYHERGYVWVGRLYFLKAGLGAIAGVTTLATAFTYSAPTIMRILGRGAVGTAVGQVSERVAAIIALRLLGMAIGTWITVATLGVQIFIWWVTPDALEEWIDHSAFGQLHGSEGFKTVEEQEKKLSEAMAQMGFEA